jgi:hypothetical protein
MGCDIHAHVEIKIGGKWHHYNHPSTDRRYVLIELFNLREEMRALLHEEKQRVA